MSTSFSRGLKVWENHELEHKKIYPFVIVYFCTECLIQDVSCQMLHRVHSVFGWCEKVLEGSCNLS